MTPAANRFAGLALSGLLASTAVAGESVDLRPALGGWVRPGEQAEIILTPLQSADEEITVDLRTATHSISTVVDTRSGTTGVLYPAPDDARLGVSLLAAGSAARDYRFELKPVPPAKRLIVAVARSRDASELDTLRVGSDVLLLNTSVDALPRHAHGYQPADALVLDRTALADMSPGQRTALAGFVGGCGPVYLLGASPAQLAELRQHGGCGGRSLHVWDELVPDELLLLASHRPMPPEDEALLDLLATQVFAADADRFPVTLLALYLLLLTVCLCWRRLNRPALLLILPVACGAVIVLRGWAIDPSIDAISWSEADSGDATSQVFEVLSVRGRGRWKGDVFLPPGASIPRGTDGEPPLTLTTHDNVPSVSLQTRFFSQQTLSFAYFRPLITDLRLGTRDGRLAVGNRGVDTSNSSLLLLGDTFYTVPALQPGEEWMPQEEAIGSGAGVPALLMQRRLKGAEAALLLHHERQWQLLRLREGGVDDR